MSKAKPIKVILNGEPFMGSVVLEVPKRTSRPGPAFRDVYLSGTLTTSKDLFKLVGRLNLEEPARIVFGPYSGLFWVDASANRGSSGRQSLTFHAYAAGPFRAKRKAAA